MDFYNFLLTESYVTDVELKNLEKYLDKMFSQLGVDFVFTKHFIERVNDERNGKQVTISELLALFEKVYRKWGKPILSLKPETEAIMRDTASHLNLPFVLGYDRYGTKNLQLRALTVMRKKVFKSPDRMFVV